MVERATSTASPGDSVSRGSGRVRLFSLWALTALLEVVFLVPVSGQDGGMSGVFEAPEDLAICQIAYGDPGAVRLSWSNPESYEEIVVLVDGEEVPVHVDGAHGTAEADVMPGAHDFEVQGFVGESSSIGATLSFEVLAVSPVQDPVSELACQFFPASGGAIVISWTPGTDAWVLGEVRLGGRLGNVEFTSGESEVNILLDGERPETVEVAFKNEDRYFSEPQVVDCLLLTPTFLRGDCDGNGEINITDPIFLLNHLFLAGPRWYCDDACDANDNGRVDQADSLMVLQYLFRGEGPTPAPGPLSCGVDPSEDFLGGLCENACI